MADEETEKAFRALEKELDSHHTTLPFFSVEPGLAAFAFLAAFDGLYGADHLITPESQFDVRKMQIRRSLEEGLAQALRWMLPYDSSVDVVPTAQDELLIEAIRFIRAAASYNEVETWHVMYGKGWIDVDAEPALKAIRFLPSKDRDNRKVMAGYDEGWDSRPIVKKGKQAEFVASVKAAHGHVDALAHELRDGRIVLTDLEQLNHPSIVAFQKLLDREFEDIPSDADLGGFTIAQYQRFWSALARWSRCAVHLHFNGWLLNQSRSGGMPTQCVPKAEFINGMSRLVGLDTATTEAIAERLRWGGSIKRPDIYLQPLIIGPNTVSWSPRVIELSKYSRNLLKVMTRMGGATKKIADNLIGQREKPASERLGHFLANRKRARWQFTTGRKIKGGGKEGEIDLLAWTPDRPDEVLLIEYKATLEVAEIHEIDEATVQMQKGQDQLRRCIEILRALPVDRKKVLFPFVPWDKIKSLYGIVVSAAGNPSNEYDNREIPAVSLMGFCKKLRSNDYSKPSRLWAACREREWLAYFDGHEPKLMRIKIGDLSYFIPAIGHSDEPDAMEIAEAVDP